MQRNQELSLIFVGCSLAVSTAQAQQRPLTTPSTYTLSMAASRTLNVPSFTPSAGTQCDSRGEVYFGITESVYSHKLVLRVSSDGTDSALFPFPTDIDAAAEWHFTVAPDGDVYVLASVFKGGGKNTLVKFSNSGEELNRRVLSLPTGFSVQSLAAQSDGHIFIAGFIPLTSEQQTETDRNETKQPEGRISNVLLDQSGNSVLVSNTGRFAIMKGFPSVVAAGSNGTFLGITNTTLSVYGVTGDLRHTYEFLKPTSDARVRNLQYLDGKIAIDFTRIIPGKAELVDPKNPDIKVGPLEDIWLLLDAYDGSMQGFYAMPADFVGTSLCYVGNHQFLNFSMENKQSVFLTGTMR